MPLRLRPVPPTTMTLPLPKEGHRAMPGYLKSGAELSLDAAYRWHLWRVWDWALPSATFVMLNPSTANADVDDNTIRRCVRFAQDWGFGRLDVFNLYALRSRDPRTLWRHPNPVGRENDDRLVAYVRGNDFGPYVRANRGDPHRPPSGPAQYGIVVCAWGAHGARQRRDIALCRRLNAAGVLTHRIGPPNRNGTPQHPLYLPKTLVPQLFLHDDA